MRTLPALAFLSLLAGCASVAPTPTARAAGPAAASAARPDSAAGARAAATAGSGTAAASGSHALSPGDVAHFQRIARDVRRRLSMVPGTVGVMLIDLRTGGEVAVNADVSMHAASTMKVPVLLELFRQAAEGRFALDDSVTVTNTFTSIADGSTYHLSPNDDSEYALYRMVGRRTTLRDLAFRMITASSNLATNNLIGLVGADSVQRLMRRMGTADMVVLRGVEDIPAFDRGMNNHTTARALARIFADIARCERGAPPAALKALGRRACRDITNILAQQEFNEKIPAGLPPGIRVAHKTGWITGIDHDAGLVYPPGQPPYALAILTHDVPSTAEADSVARDISRIVWRELAAPRVHAPLSADSARALFALAGHVRVPGMDRRDFDYGTYWDALGPIVDRAADLSRDSIGASAEGRTLWAVHYGHGPITVLLWSQMHGNESTATMALADLFSFLATSPGTPLARTLASRLTMVAVPMLNPDGAQRFQRRDALGIDINRDARALVTPEARALKALRDSLKPEFGFNLHDQNADTRVGKSDATAAISLLAPAFAPRREFDAVRERAARVAAGIRLAIEPFVGGHITRYDATFNPRAFGDLMTRWGTSTVLIESGAWHDDPEKQYLRRVNFVALLAALDAIATGRYRDVAPGWYTTLPLNGERVPDLLVRGGTLVLPGLSPTRADLAVRFAHPLRRTGGSVADVGDLAGDVARDTLDASGLFIHPAADFPAHALDSTSLVGLPADFVLTASPDPGAAPVWLIHDGRAQHTAVTQPRK